MTLCKVYGCRYANSHVTKDHKCGNCNRFGHGRVECESFKSKTHLQSIIQILLVVMTIPLSNKLRKHVFTTSIT